MSTRRSFALGVAAGAFVTLVWLGTLDLANVPRIEPILETDPEGFALERFVVGKDDILTVTSQAGAVFPGTVKRLQGEALADAEVTTMKVRNARNDVIGVASRIAGTDVEPELRSVWWTFVLGERGTLAAWLPDARNASDGVVAGGTADFERSAGRFGERMPGPGTYELSLRIEPAP